MTQLDLPAFVASWDDVAGGWRGGDGLWSVGHPETGDVAFACGDTVIDDVGFRAFPQSSLVIWRAGRLWLSSHPDGWLPPTGVADEFRWPGPMAFDAGLLWTVGHRLRRVDSGWGFELVRRELHAFSWRAGGRPEYVGTADMPFAGGIEWGAELLPLGEHLYVYGTIVPHGFGADVYLARMPARALSDPVPARWEYRTGAGHRSWSRDPSLARPVIPAAIGPESTFSAAWEGERVHIVSKMHGVWGPQVTRWWSSSPAGPFSPVQEAVHVPWTAADMTYATHAHHALPRTPEGEVMVSVSHNYSGATLAELFTPAGWNRYRPSWHSVPLT